MGSRSACLSWENVTTQVLKNSASQQMPRSELYLVKMLLVHHQMHRSLCPTARRILRPELEARDLVMVLTTQMMGISIPKLAKTWNFAFQAYVEPGFGNCLDLPIEEL
ncbi:hypothetical protein MKW98_020624 [Papaver atlanticum]|uniref:Uncharacterized protein n=1 Tax=Papaver atlanticum TaxID=357466 RepID=A0AAD4XY84_9MAGN|nr:hypothetical protein MKW98_020624 [Papaver atlanticum]